MDLKWIALIALIFQNSGLAIVMRYTFIADVGERYIPSTAVLNAEIMKLVISVIACFVYDSEKNVSKFKEVLHAEFVGNSGDWFRLMVPSVLYTIQNSLQYYSMSCLSAPVFQVLYQLKIVTTAVFSVFILSKRLNISQWISIVSLTCGVALVQLSQSNDDGTKTNSMMGLISVLCGCLTSGFAGVYFELVLKSSSASIWLRNIQLSVIGIVMSALSCYTRDFEPIYTRGLFTGYNTSVWGVIILQAAGGLIVAVVVKYADNVLKGFATSLSILISCAVSALWFNDISLNLAFILGAMIVLAAVYVYGVAPTNAPIVSDKSAGPKSPSSGVSTSTSSSSSSGLGRMPSFSAV